MIRVEYWAVVWRIVCAEVIGTAWPADRRTGVSCSVGVLHCSTVLYPSRRRFLSILDAACYASTTLWLQQLVLAECRPLQPREQVTSDPLMFHDTCYWRGRVSHCYMPAGLAVRLPSCRQPTADAQRPSCILYIAVFFICCVTTVVDSIVTKLSNFKRCIRTT